MRLTVSVVFALAALAGPASGENLLSIESGQGLPGTNGISLGVLAKHDEPMHAFSLALRYDELAMTFIGFDLDAPGAVTGQIGYEYKHIINDAIEGNLIVAVLLDLDSPYDFREIPASPDAPQLLGRLGFSVNAGAFPGLYQIQLRNGVGSPPVENVFSVRGRTVNPALVSAQFTVINPHHLTILDSTATAGGSSVIQVEGNHLEPIGGFEVVIRYPSDVLSIDRDPLDDPADDLDFVETDVCKWPITFCGFNLEQWLGMDRPDRQPIESFSAWAEPDFAYGPTAPGTGSGRLWAYAIFDRVTPFRDQVLPPGKQRFMRVRFSVAPSVPLGTEIPITLINGTGDPALDNLFVVPVPGQPDASVRPDLHNGVIKIVSGFKRGHVNSWDSRVDIGDVIYLLSFFFNKGEAPPCEKAADANDDGKTDIGDAIRLLSYLFAHGPPPPEPFEACGPDGTPDLLTCDTPTGC